MIEDAFAQYLLQDTGFRRVTDLWIRQYQKLQHFEQYVSRILRMMSVRQLGAYSVRITGESVTFPYLILSGKRQSRTAGLPEVIFFVYSKFIREKAY